jgi:hypothetical protein
VSWSYNGNDPGLELFTRCLDAGAPMTFTPGMRILEACCCEADWLHPAHTAWPDAHLTGIDWRAPQVVDGDGKVTRLKGNLLDPDLFPAESFDACVSLSAIEHIGLGHYRDPVDPDGDSKAMANIWRWLKLGGWLYFDVPYDPKAYRVQGTKCRVYDDVQVVSRLSQGWNGAGGCAWCRFVSFEGRELGPLTDRPTRSVHPFHLVACVWRKS